MTAEQAVGCGMVVAALVWLAVRPSARAELLAALFPGRPSWDRRRQHRQRMAALRRRVYGQRPAAWSPSWRDWKKAAGE